MLTLTHVGKVGDADKYELTDTDDGYEHKFIVTDAEQASDRYAVQKAIRSAVDRYHATNKVPLNG